MELYNASFKGHDRLFLCIGKRSKHLYLLDSLKVPNNEADKIKSTNLSLMDIDTRIAWIKTNCPISYSSAFRTIKEGELKIYNVYDVTTK